MTSWWALESKFLSPALNIQIPLTPVLSPRAGRGSARRGRVSHPAAEPEEALRFMRTAETPSVTLQSRSLSP